MAGIPCMKFAVSSLKVVHPFPVFPGVIQLQLKCFLQLSYEDRVLFQTLELLGFAVNIRYV